MCFLLTRVTVDLIYGITWNLGRHSCYFLRIASPNGCLVLLLSGTPFSLFSSFLLSFPFFSFLLLSSFLEGDNKYVLSCVIQHEAGGLSKMRLDGKVCSGWFFVEQGLRQGCVLAPLLFDILFASVMNVAYTHFKADKDIMDALVVVVVVVSHIQRIGCQPEKNYFTRWPIPLVVC